MTGLYWAFPDHLDEHEMLGLIVEKMKLSMTAATHRAELVRQNVEA